MEMLWLEWFQYIACLLKKSTKNISLILSCKTRWILIQSMKNLLMGLIQYIFMKRNDFDCIKREYMILGFISDEIKRAVECFPLNGSIRSFFCTV